MANLLLPPSWRLPESTFTPERAWLDRRAFLKGLGLTGASALAVGTGLVGCAMATPTEDAIPKTYAYTLPPYGKSTKFTTGGPARPPTPEAAAASYNNFYEFGTDKEKVWQRAASLAPKPWTVAVTGAVGKPRTFDLDELLRTMPLEERVYRFRCVEAWSMVVPWIGFPLAALLDAVEPLGSARYLRLTTLGDASRMPGIASQPWYPWPYYEGLSMAEARNELTLLAVGIYGHPLPNQHGAPIRLVVPWKYGYKNIKSIVKIEVLPEKPATFWNDLAPTEYDFGGNVNPRVAHPRWSQAGERVLPTGEKIPTLLYNGYAEQVASLYPELPG